MKVHCVQIEIQNTVQNQFSFLQSQSYCQAPHNIQNHVVLLQKEYKYPSTVRPLQIMLLGIESALVKYVFFEQSAVFVALMQFHFSLCKSKERSKFRGLWSKTPFIISSINSMCDLMKNKEINDILKVNYDSHRYPPHHVFQGGRK